MQKRRRIPAEGAGQVLLLPPELIRPNPGQPRRSFDRESLQELADSIQRHGILQPIAVRRQGGGYELIAGERRLRAAKLAGLPEIPCLLLSADEAQSGLLALVENLQRKDLDCWEEAEGIARLMQRCGLSQEEAARRLGKSPSAVANKLRLLKLPPDVLENLRSYGLSERHGRALLRLPEPGSQRMALEYIAANDLTVAATEEYIEALLTAPEEAQEKPEPRRTLILKDVRVFLNSLNRSLDLMKQGGIDAGVKRVETDDSLILTISIPKGRTPVN